MIPEPKDVGPRRAVADEEPEAGVTDGLARKTGPAQPMDVDSIERDRAKSIGPKPSDLPDAQRPSGDRGRDGGR